MKMLGIALGLYFVVTGVAAEPVTFNIDPNHTYPSFEADHMGGMSIWRGKFRRSSGSVTLDREAHTGKVNITVDTSSVDFGHDELNEHAKGPDIFDVAKFPTATYTGTFTKFDGDTPTVIDGELTLHGVTKPLKLFINSFKCQVNPMIKKFGCGADASATFDRSDFGIDFGKAFHFKMEVKLAIQVEAIKAD
jgi:polyisoprenoid-binding protein YceI